MGRHSLDPAPQASAVRQVLREPIAPVTDPVLLDAVESELRRLRVEEPPTAAAPRSTRRIETPFSGPVDVPEEDVIGPHRPVAPPLLVISPRPSGSAVPRTPGGPSSAVPRPAPRPVPARPAAPRSAVTGPAIVPSHRPSPGPVEAPRDLETDETAARIEPVGLSLRTLLLGTGVGLLASTALSLLALLPR